MRTGEAGIFENTTKKKEESTKAVTCMLDLTIVGLSMKNPIGLARITPSVPHVAHVPTLWRQVERISSAAPSQASSSLVEVMGHQVKVKYGYLSIVCAD